MSISSYKDLLSEANKQPEHQQLLFVFAKAEPSESKSEEEMALFNAGKGGVLTPVMCIDKPLDELSDFADLSKEAEQMSEDWKIVFVGCLDGKIGEKLNNEKIDKHLKDMAQSIQQGMVSNYLAFDNDGELVKFA